MASLAASPPRQPGLSRPAVLGLALGGLLLASIIANLRLGAVAISGADLLAVLAGATPADPSAELVLMGIRGPRMVAAMAVGAGLALAGAAMQALFRNPLAEPGLLGVSTGAALGAAGWLVAGGTVAALVPAGLLPFGLPLMGFLGAVAAIVLVLALGARSRGPEATLLMLLIGIGVNAMGGALIGMASYVATDTELRALSTWMMGSLAQVEQAVLVPALLLLSLAAAGIATTARSLDLLALGEAPAQHLGLDTDRLRRLLGLMVALIVGAAVALSGIIGFVGLIVPHIVRLIAGPGHRALLPLVALGGAVLLSLADLAARLVALPAEVPVGIVMALVGAPAFLALLLGRVRGGLQ
ncbi:MAG: iron ABC transporter permease [Sandarakinorhabdus sp.]|jgi:iron complex transport system permease protein|nr:iron ABC transporter permease [Sandarakinorhabdus sp.]